MHRASASNLLTNLIPLFLLAFFGFSNNSWADSVTVTCTDVGGEQENCTLESTNGASSTAMIELIGDIINAVNGNTREGSCSRQGNDISCSVGEADLQLACTVQQGEEDNSATCSLNDLPAEVLSLDCLTQGSTGECTLQNQPAEIIASLPEAAIENLTANEIDVLGNVITGCGFQSGTSAFQDDCNALLSILGGGDADQITALVDAITPKNADAVADANVFKAQQLTSTIRRRLARVRGGDTGVDTTAVRYFDGQQWVQAGQMFAANQAETMTDAGSASNGSIFDTEKFGVFIDAAIANTEYDANDNENGSETDDTTITVGLDYRINPNLIGGMAMSIATITTEYGSNRGEVDTENFTLLAYGSYYKDAWYVDATFGMGGDRYDQSRVINCSVSDCGVDIDNQSLSADYYGDQVSFTIGGGYDFSYGEWAATPFVQYASTSITVDDYQEEAGDPDAPGAGYALNMDEQDRDSTTLTVGSDLRYTMSQDWGVLVPYVGIEFINEMDDDAVVISGRFLGNVGTGDKFELATGEIDSSYSYLSFGASAIFAGGGSAFIDVRTLQGYEDTDQIRFTGGYRAAF
ncbi:MAG: autotransporter outer membrane beta-barrel domain-containing protein [Pseudomonadales bacterium]|nr:autotransporter outer membrane beta-barrel domain-containing protein [Pseudomonadales bacterium]